jgi:hypothetical protein
MHAFWLFFAAPVMGLSYTFYAIAKDGMPYGETPILRSKDFDPDDYISHPLQRREIKWISQSEYRSLLRTTEVIVINLTNHSSTGGRRSDETRELFVTPDQLLPMLRWLPPQSNVVFYGDSETCSSILDAAQEVLGLAPIYVLAESPATHRVA